jgi:hypothetical protein
MRYAQAPKTEGAQAGASNVTLDIYSHLIPTMQEDAAARLDAAFQSAMNRAPGSR